MSGIAAVYHLNGIPSPLCPDSQIERASWLIPEMLLSLQHRGQLAAGFTVFNAARQRILSTAKNSGTVEEVFKGSHRFEYESLMEEHSGQAAIGHVRYATAGVDAPSYAQPFENHNLHRFKWFSVALQGQFANYSELRNRVLRDSNYHLIEETDRELFVHEIAKRLEQGKPLLDVATHVSRELDGAYNFCLLNAAGQLLVARDPLGIRPLSFAIKDGLFAAASEDIALLTVGFQPSDIQSLAPGHAVLASQEDVKVSQFAESRKLAHCFFEWTSFSSMVSTLNDCSVYVARRQLGAELAREEKNSRDFEIDANTIVVPVPDNGKALADGYAYELDIPVADGIVRNRSGKSYIGYGNRRQRLTRRYMPLAQVLTGKRVILVDDCVVRSTAIKIIVEQLRSVGLAKEVHVRIGCPPIIAPCFYGIDMSTTTELFAPRFLSSGQLTRENQMEMAMSIGADTLRFLPLPAISTAIGIDASSLCLGCVTGRYPTDWGQKLYNISQNIAAEESEAVVDVQDTLKIHGEYVREQNETTLWKHPPRTYDAPRHVRK